MVWRKKMRAVTLRFHGSLRRRPPSDQSSDPDTIVVPVARSFWVSPKFHQPFGVLASWPSKWYKNCLSNRKIKRAGLIHFQPQVAQFKRQHPHTKYEHFNQSCASSQPPFSLLFSLYSFIRLPHYHSYKEHQHSGAAKRCCSSTNCGIMGDQ